MTPALRNVRTSWPEWECVWRAWRAWRGPYTEVTKRVSLGSNERVPQRSNNEDGDDDDDGDGDDADGGVDGDDGDNAGDFFLLHRCGSL